MRSLLGLVAVMLSVATACAAPDEKFLRAVTDGPGLQAIFRVARLDSTTDLFGIVDPVLRRVQFYRLQDQNGVRPLKDRMTPVGDCLLPAKFRFWRLHHLSG